MNNRTRVVIIAIGSLFSLLSITFKIPFVDASTVLYGAVIGLGISAVFAVYVSKSAYLQTNLVAYAGSNYDRDGLLLTVCSPKYNRWFWLSGLLVGGNAGLHYSAIIGYLTTVDIKAAFILGVYALCCFGAFVAYFAFENVISLQVMAIEFFVGGSPTWSLDTFALSALAAIGFGEFGGLVCGAYTMGFITVYYFVYQAALYIGLWVSGIIFGVFCCLSGIIQCVTRWYACRPYTKVPSLSESD